MVDALSVPPVQFKMLVEVVPAPLLSEPFMARVPPLRLMVLRLLAPRLPTLKPPPEKVRDPPEMLSVLVEIAPTALFAMAAPDAVELTAEFPETVRVLLLFVPADPMDKTPLIVAVPPEKFALLTLFDVHAPTTKVLESIKLPVLSYSFIAPNVAAVPSALPLPTATLRA